ncbi:MAG: FHA domain-containing protein [Chloroflexi bacterium]|nr:FHA domain-containing protein [Chloroflexota bacterium]
MQHCPRCTHNNLDGALICSRCRQPLSHYVGLATRQMRAVLDMQDMPLPSPKPLAAPVATKHGKLTLQIEGAEQPLVVENQGHILIGRASSHSVRVPDVDLAPYHAFNKGVSSLHATIFRAEEGLCISDLGSLNGTYLNRECLTPHMGYALHTGDIIYLGQMAMQVYFE